jgi:hypothetical protein
MSLALGLRVKAILSISWTTRPDEHFAFLRRHFESPFVEEGLARAIIARSAALFMHNLRVHRMTNIHN